MKRFLSLMLSVVMLSLLVASAVPVFAEDVKPFTVQSSGESYATLTEAVANADANVENGDTIILTANYEAATDDVNIAVDKALTIKSAEGKKYTINITADADAGARWIKASKNLTIENVDIVTTQGIELTGGEFNLTNSNVDMDISVTSVAPADENRFKVNGAWSFLSIGGASVKLTNSNIDYRVDTGNGNFALTTFPIFIYGNDNTVSFTLVDNSTIVNNSDTTNSIAGNSVVVIDYNNPTTKTGKTTAVIEVGDGCVISNKQQQSGTNGVRPPIVFYLRGTDVHDVTLNLKSGSNLEIVGKVVTYSSYKPGFVYGDGGQIVINDYGCTFSVTSTAKASAGSDHHKMYFPTIDKINETQTPANEKFFTTAGTTVENGGTATLTKGTTYEFKFGTYVPAFKVGENTYETLSEAIAAANADDTIYVQRDVSVSETALTVDKNLTIKSTDGEKFTITVVADAAANARWIKSSANLTIENVTIQTSQGIEATAGTLTLKNVTANQTTSVSGNGNTTGGFSFILANNSTVNLNGSTITHNALNNGNAITLTGTATTLNMTNGAEVISNGTGASSSSMGVNFTIIARGDSTDGKININVGKDCRIVNQLNIPTTYLRPSGLIMLVGWDNTTADRFNISLADGSELYLNTRIVGFASGGSSAPTYFPGFISYNCTLNENYGQVITDNGCTYTAKYVNSTNAEARFDSGRIHFPYVSANETNADYKFVNADGEPVDNGGSYKCTAGKEVSFKFQAPATPLLTNTAGASIRTDEPYGIRFRGEVNKDVYADLIADENVKSVTFGIAIANMKVTFDKDFFDNNIEGEDGNYFSAEYNYDKLASDGTYTMAIYFTDDTLLANSGKDVFTAKMYACAYYIVEYNDGTPEDVVFADFNENDNVRSIYDVAKAYSELSTYTETEFVERIISVCETA